MRKWLLLLFVSFCLPHSPILSQNKVITHYHYWFDTTREGETLAAFNAADTLNLTLNTTNLSVGLHYLSYRFKDSGGVWSPVDTWLFYRGELRDTTFVNGAKMVEYWLDGDRSSLSQVSTAGDSIAFTVDASTLNEGLHTLYYRVKDKLNHFGPVSSWLFYRGELRDTTLVNGAKMVEYWLDGDRSSLSQVSTAGDSIAFAIDASTLNEGLHTLYYRVKDKLDHFGPVYTWLFYKREPAKALKITWYKYWWNNHLDQTVVCPVEVDSSVFVLDLRLSLPEYIMNDGYSTNSTARFHIQFGDDAGHVSGVEWQDIKYPDVIPPISSIQADAEQTNESVALTWTANEDSIRCFNIYYSEDFQPFILWLPNTTQRSANFKGQKGSSYRFTVTAQDDSGNCEQLDDTKFISVYFTDND